MSVARSLATAALIASIVGCAIHLGPLGLEVGSGSSSGSWGGGTSGTHSDRTDGQVSYSIGHLTHDGTIYLVLVLDGSGAFISHRGGPPGGGELSTLDGRTIAWNCRTDDGKNGTVTIAGTDFPLVDGGLFLVSARHGKTWVRQAKCDVASIKGTVDLAGIRTAAASDPIAADFLKRIDTPREANPIASEK